jgi:uncharacterized membrane protein YgdD (TMEM256/DUF423 family)
MKSPALEQKLRLVGAVQFSGDLVVAELAFETKFVRLGPLKS